MFFSHGKKVEEMNPGTLELLIPLFMIISMVMQSFQLNFCIGRYHSKMSPEREVV